MQEQQPPVRNTFVLYEAVRHTATEEMAQRLRDMGHDARVVTDPSTFVFKDGDVFVEIFDLHQDRRAVGVQRESIMSARGASDDIKAYRINAVMDDAPVEASETTTANGTIIPLESREQQIQTKLGFILAFAGPQRGPRVDGTH